ncbi:MAG: MBL fold metallo-hydrolase [Candidatus Peribacteraceae bacterium]|nr:MBL fold metallo-hydrolase [Candidatus Peribacteraceae bacterium]MDD5074967.1 MBL fold metallo-hydrolase [Candidatus Peribacteraceae bacterium]
MRTVSLWRRWKLWLLCGVVLLPCVLVAGRELSLLPDGQTHVYVLDIGQGDSILIVSPIGRRILVDGGPDLSALERLGSFLPFFDRRIDLVAFTHPDADHIGSLPEILQRYRVDRMLFSPVEHGSGQYARLLSIVEKQHIPLILPDPSQDIDSGDGLVLDVIWPPKNLVRSSDDTNGASLVMRALARSGSILLTGDIDALGEERILKTGASLSSTVLKVSHHGSEGATSIPFLLAVKPDHSVISVGKDNRFGHPRPETLARLSALGIPIRTTMEEGTIDFLF